MDLQQPTPPCAVLGIAQSMYPNSAERRIRPNRIMNSSRVVSLCPAANRESCLSNWTICRQAHHSTTQQPQVTSLFSKALPATETRSLFSRAYTVHNTSDSDKKQMFSTPKFSPRLPANGPADPDIHRCLTRVGLAPPLACSKRVGDGRVDRICVLFSSHLAWG